MAKEATTCAIEKEDICIFRKSISFENPEDPCLHCDGINCRYAPSNYTTFSNYLATKKRKE